MKGYESTGLRSLENEFRNDRAVARLAIEGDVSPRVRVYALRQFAVRSAQRCDARRTLGLDTVLEHRFQARLKRALDNLGV